MNDVILTSNERAWLIEWPVSDNLPARWWHPQTGWMIDANKAARFSRQQDAEAFIKAGCFCRPIVATEHGWIAPAHETLPCALPPPVALSETDVAIAQTAATARAEMCGICDEEFIGHRHGARGHDWMPKSPPPAQKAKVVLPTCAHGATSEEVCPECMGLPSDNPDEEIS